jgi:hypothetical protein
LPHAPRRSALLCSSSPSLILQPSLPL